MKTLKLITAGLLSLFAFTGAATVTEIRIIGSTAFRLATDHSIQDMLQTGYVWGSTTGDGLGANQQIFVGLTKTSNIQVIIKTAWTGSVGGVQALVKNVTAGQPFIIDPTGVSFSGANATATVHVTPLTAAGASIAAGDITESHTADVTLSDIYVSTTPYIGTALTDTIIGVVPFEWVKGAYTPNGTLGSAVAGGYPGVTNITIDEAQGLLSGGISLNQLTGVNSDNPIVAYVIGSDHGSGTRVAALYDGQYGGFVFGAPTDAFQASVLQYIANGQTVGTTQFAAQSAGSGVISSLSPWTMELTVNEERPFGSEGFFSDSYVAISLNRPCDTSQGNYIISYLGMSDSNRVNPGAGYSYTDGLGHTTMITPSQNALTFDGTYPGTATHPFGPPYTNIIKGIYTFWGYEHFLYSVAIATTPKAVADQLSNQVTTEADYFGVGIRLSDMQSSRVGDGLPVTSP
jgi:hypothetical protein